MRAAKLIRPQGKGLRGFEGIQVTHSRMILTKYNKFLGVILKASIWQVEILQVIIIGFQGMLEGTGGFHGVQMTSVTIVFLQKVKEYLFCKLHKILKSNDAYGIVMARQMTRAAIFPLSLLYSTVLLLLSKHQLIRIFLWILFHRKN